MAEPTVTALIPTYRRPQRLRRAVESVLAQAYPHVRVLVADNASGDGTAEVVADLQRRDDRVIYHCHPRNMGSVYNFRFAMDAVDTEFFSILSDDDVLLPNFYRGALDALTANPDARFFCGQAVLYDEIRGTHGLRPHDRWRDGFHEAGRWALLMTELHFTWTACVFHAGVRDLIGPIAPVSIADVLYLVTAAAHVPFVVRLEPCAVYLQTGQNQSSIIPMSSVRESYEVMLQRCQELPVTDDKRREILDAVERHFAIVANGMLRAALESGNSERLDEVADFLEDGGGLTPKQRLRVALARRSLPTRWLVSRMVRLSAGYKRLRRSGWQKLTLDEVVTHYSAGSKDAAARPADRPEAVPAG